MIVKLLDCIVNHRVYRRKNWSFTFCAKLNVFTLLAFFAFRIRIFDEIRSALIFLFIKYHCVMFRITVQIPLYIIFQILIITAPGTSLKDGPQLMKS